MKQYYESEVLHHLMEREGFNIPSSVPKYESEIKAYLINQVKLAYPKLTDYEAEWLLYNYTKHLPADFPISSATNVTKASFENVVPFAYQKAILKGQTLVSINSYGNESTISSSKVQRNINSNMIEVGQKYLICIETLNSIEPTIIRYEQYSGSAWANETQFTVSNAGIYKTVITATVNFNQIRVNNASSNSLTFKNFMLIEYQEGMENWDIPYFEGMQSVKMPVLTTTGKNLFDAELVVEEVNKKINIPIVIENNSLTITSTNLLHHCYKYRPINFEPNKQYVLSANIKTESSQAGTVLGFVHTDGSIAFITKDRQTVTSVKGKSVDYITFSYGVAGIVETWSNIQIEEGTTATSYEPFKSNILTVNEPIELRGIGDVKDELNLLTGEVTERIGEVVLDGSNSFGYHFESNSNEMTTMVHVLIPNTNQTFKFYNDKLVEKYIYENASTTEGIFSEWNGLYIRLLNSKLQSANIEGVKKYLQENPITLQYELAQESIKTVELKTVNEKGEITHFMPLEGTMNVQSSGENIQPTFDMSVPVEATTQNLASFIDLEMEE